MGRREQGSLTLNRSLARRMLYRCEQTALAVGLSSNQYKFPPNLTPEAIAYGSPGEDAPSPDEGNQL